MPTAYFTSNKTSPDYYATYGSNYPWSHDISIPTTRIASNGKKPLKVVSVEMYFAAYADATTAELTMNPGSGGYSGTSQLSVTQASSAYSVTFPFNMGIGDTAVTSSCSISVDEPDTGYSLRVGNNTASSDTIKIGTYTGRRLWGKYTYLQVPSTPTITSVTADSANQQLNVSWTATSDWGGATTGKQYFIRVSKSSSVDSNGNFTDSFATKTGISGTETSASIDIPDNTSTTTYYVQLYAYNELSSFSGGPKSVPNTYASGVDLPPPVPPPVWIDSLVSTYRVGEYRNRYARVTTTAPPLELTVVEPTTTTDDYGLETSESGTASSKYLYLSGRPTKSGSAVVSVEAKDDYDQISTFTKTITISGPGTPTATLAFPDGSATQQYTTTTKTITYAQSASWSWLGAQPAGLSVSITQASETEYAKITLSGTPGASTGGTYTIRVIATGFPDGTLTAPEATLDFTVDITALPTPVWIDDQIEQVAAINRLYEDSVSATNVTSYNLVGAPAWLSIDDSGNLTGTPIHDDVTYGQNTDFTIEGIGENETIEIVRSIDVVHPIGIHSDADGGFVYPDTRATRYDEAEDAFVNIEWIKRYDSSIQDWVHVRIN